MAIDPIDATDAPPDAVESAVADKCTEIKQPADCVTAVFKPDSRDEGCIAISANPNIYAKEIEVGTTVTFTVSCPEDEPGSGDLEEGDQPSTEPTSETAT